MNRAEIMETETRFSLGLYPKRSVVLTRGLGTLVWDDGGKEYLDCSGGHGVCLIGHNNPAVVQAIAEQAQKMIYCPNTFYNETRARLFEKLASVSPKGLNKTFLCNSGTEAVEAGIKFARAITGKKKIIAAFKGFHGRTMGALSATWNKHYREPFEPLVPGFSHVRYGDSEALRQAIDGDTAAFLVEPIQGESGVNFPPRDYLREVREICDEKNILLVVDEVQTGFGRTGEMFACQHSDVVPDVLCLSKAMGGGFPIGATIVKEEHAPKIGVQTHGTTFGGNPLACAASLATIGVIQDQNLCETAAVNGRYFLDKLTQLQDDGNANVVEARGLGLMLGLEVKNKALPMLLALVERGLLVLPAGPHVIRFLPPLTIRREEIDLAVEKLGKVF